MVIVALLVLAGFIVYVAGVPIPGLSAAEGQQTVQKAGPLKIECWRRASHPPCRSPRTSGRPWASARAAERIATVQPPTEARPLVLSGSTGAGPHAPVPHPHPLHPGRVHRDRQVGRRSAAGTTRRRELHSGDRVHKGDLLGIFYSVDVGNKKNDLVDAIVQLKLDEKILTPRSRPTTRGACPSSTTWRPSRAVEGDYNTISRAENTLRAWTIPEEDIDAVRKEAEEINDQGGQRDRDTEHLKEQLRRWAQVELHVPDEADGTIVERNVDERETGGGQHPQPVPDRPGGPAAGVGQRPRRQSAVLQALPPTNGAWIVRTAGAPPRGIPGAIDDIGYIIDVSQHNAVVKGYIPNTEGVMRSGQYVTATIHLPPPEDVVEVPTNALADDGKQAVVFVQADDKKPGVYTMRRVEIVQRLRQDASSCAAASPTARTSSR